MKPYENNIILGLIRLFQLIFIVFFSTLVLMYYSSLLLVPAFLIIQASPLLIWIFDGGGVPILILIAVLVYAANFLSRQRGIFDLVAETGKELIRLGRKQYDLFQQAAKSVKA
ncbi:MAG: hypothetical protein V3V31_15850 [Methylococcales bacterium]